jgi:hypothetical protein
MSRELTDTEKLEIALFLLNGGQLSEYDYQCRIAENLDLVKSVECTCGEMIEIISGTIRRCSNCGRILDDKGNVS